MAEEAVVVVAGGSPPPRDVARGIPPGTTVIAADGGLENARALGLMATTAIAAIAATATAARTSRFVPGSLDADTGEGAGAALAGASAIVFAASGGWDVGAAGSKRPVGSGPAAGREPGTTRVPGILVPEDGAGAGAVASSTRR